MNNVKWSCQFPLSAIHLRVFVCVCDTLQKPFLTFYRRGVNGGDTCRYFPAHCTFPGPAKTHRVSRFPAKFKQLIRLTASAQARSKGIG